MTEVVHVLISRSGGSAYKNPATSAGGPDDAPGDCLYRRRDTRSRDAAPETELLAHSQDVGWRSLHAAISRKRRSTLPNPALDHPFIIYHITHPTEVMRKIEGARREKRLLSPRNICVTPPGTATEWEHHGNRDPPGLPAPFAVRRRLAICGCDATAAEIVPRFGIVDPLLEQLSIALAEALRSGAVRDGLYVDTIAQMMAVHLARTHSAQSRPGALPPTLSTPISDAAAAEFVGKRISISPSRSTR